MALLKAPSKQPKTTTLQVRLEEEVRHNLDRYAEFIGANPTYVVSEALRLLFRKDKAFKHRQANTETIPTPDNAKETLLRRLRNRHEAPSNTIRYAREYSVLKTACPAPCNECSGSTVRPVVCNGAARQEHS